MEENSEYVNSLWTGEAFGLRLSFLALLEVVAVHLQADEHAAHHGAHGVRSYQRR